MWGGVRILFAHPLRYELINCHSPKEFVAFEPAEKINGDIQEKYSLNYVYNAITHGLRNAQWSLLRRGFTLILRLKSLGKLGFLEAKISPEDCTSFPQTWNKYWTKEAVFFKFPSTEDSATLSYRLS